MQDIARESPEKTLELAALISSLRNSPVGSNDYAQGAAIPAVMAALGYALLYQVSTPENQEQMRIAANTVIENTGKYALATKEETEKQLRILMGLWELVTLTAFPIHLLDDKHRKLVNPIVDASGRNPASGGYSEGGGVVTTPHTGGTQLDGVQTGGAYVIPEHKLNPGVIFNSSSTPEGRVLTDHSVESLQRHGFKDLKQVDDVINNAIHKINQSDGAVVFVQKVGGVLRRNIIWLLKVKRVLLLVCVILIELIFRRWPETKVGKVFLFK